MEDAKHDMPDIPQNEIRISAKAGVGRYVRYVYNLMEKDEKTFDEVTLKAAGRAMERIVPLVEILKRRIKGLHQLNKITSTTETREDGSPRVIVTFEIKLSKNKLSDDGIGYQKPIPEDQVEEYKEIMPRDDEHEEHAPRGRGSRGFRGGRGSRGHRGGRGTRGGRGFRGGRGSRGGRGFRGGRGGYGYHHHEEDYYDYNNQHYDDGYDGYYEKPYYDQHYDEQHYDKSWGYDDAPKKEHEKPLEKPARGTRGRGTRRGGRGTRGRGSA